MSISELHPQPRPAAVLADAVAVIQDLDHVWWSSQSDDELVAVVEQIEKARSALAAVQAGAVAEADTRGLAKHRLHYGSSGDWLTHVAGLRKGEGRRIVARAHALTGALSDTREALAAGRVSPEQADVIVSSIRQLPSMGAVRTRGETALLEHAESLDATSLAKAGRHLIYVVDPDGHDRKLERQLAREERASHATRFLSIIPDRAGGVRIQGRGTVEDGALVKAALLPLTVPATAMHDERGEVVKDPRDHGARMWDALVEVAQHALDTEHPPESHGAPARLVVTVGLDFLKAGLADTADAGGGLTSDSMDLSASTMRRMACDAEVIPVVLGGQGEPLDVGRARRLVTLAIWVALVIRDRHCAFPACDRPPLMCHAHHVVHWLQGGETKLHNLVLLCGHHHRVLHDSPWQVRISEDDQKPEFLPPPRSDLPSAWIRHRPRRE